MIPRATWLLLLVVLSAGLVLVPAAASHAHDDLVATVPSQGAVATVGEVREVRLSFADAVAPDVTGVALSSGGTAVTTSAPRVSGREVVVATGAPLAPGEYEVAYRTVASDGHLVSGSFTFRVATGADAVAAASDAATTAPAPPDSAGPSQATTVVVLATALGLVLIGALRRRRQGWS